MPAERPDPARSAVEEDPHLHDDVLIASFGDDLQLRLGAHQVTIDDALGPRRSPWRCRTRRRPQAIAAELRVLTHDAAFHDTLSRARSTIRRSLSASRLPYTRGVPSSLPQTMLARAGAALDRGRGAEAAQIVAPVLRSSTLTRDEELALRSMLAEAWLLQDDLEQAATALGRPPDTFRETVPPGRLSTLWRLHGRLAYVRGDQSRAIALHGRALKQAELAHDSRSIGLAHYELGQCYRHVGDAATVREHITKAASALHAAGDRRHLALVHSLSGISLAELGRYDEAMAALRQAERLASVVQADDVLATVCGNQASVMMLQHRYEQALALAERSVSLHEEHGSGHGLAVALGTLGQICVRLGDLARAEEALHGRSTSAARFSFTRRPAPCSTRWRRST